VRTRDISDSNNVGNDITQEPRFSKASSADSRLQVNLSAFWINSTNIQSSIPTPPGCNTGWAEALDRQPKCKSIVAGWLRIAEALERQGETTLGGDVRHFTRHIPRVLTDKEQQALEFAQ